MTFIDNLNLEKLPTYDEMVEQQVIGAMISEPEIIADILPKVKPDDFYLQAHQTLCRYIFEIYEESGPQFVNHVEIVKKLQDNGEDAAHMVQVLNNCFGSAASYEFYMERLLDHSTARKLQAKAIEIAQWNPSSHEEVQEALSKAETMIASISDESIRDDYMCDSSSLFDHAFNYLDRVYEQKNPITGVPSGIADLDYLTAGFQKSDLIILAGRPSMGKTAFAIQLAMNMCKAGKKGIFFEIEMSDLSVALRMIANQTHINSKDLRSGQFSREERQRIQQAKQVLQKEYPLYVDTTPNLSVAMLKAKARKLKRQGELDFVIVDYLQLLTTESGRSRNEEVNDISRSLKQMARELEIPVIALAQLSRAVEQRQDKRPMLSDLRDSGGIEQDADVVMFMYRDEYYDNDSEKKNIAEVILAKQREGALGIVEVLYRKEWNLFLPLEKKGYEEEFPPAQNEVAATMDILPWEEGEI